MNRDPELKKRPERPDIDDLIFDEEAYESER